MTVQRQCRKLIAANRKDKQGAYIEETLETLDKRKIVKISQKSLHIKRKYVLLQTK